METLASKGLRMIFHKLLCLGGSNLRFVFSLFKNSSIFTIILCAVVIGQVVSMTPDYVKAKQSAQRVFYLLDKVPVIDCFSDEGLRPVRGLHSCILQTPVGDLGGCIG